MTQAARVDFPEGGENINTPMPDEVLQQIDPLAGEARLGPSQEYRCGLTPDGDLVCIPGMFSAGAEKFGELPPGSKLSGACYLTPAGDVHCDLPLAGGPTCKLGLTRIQATHSRGCGTTADGQWRCFGRASGLPAVELNGFRDVAASECEP